jgi:hypothetical protein
MYQSNVIRSNYGALWNYIPRKRKSNVSFHTWKHIYLNDLEMLYSKLSRVVNNRYDNEVKWENYSNFELFCKFVYENSSKYIYPMDRQKRNDDDDDDDDNDDDNHDDDDA